MAEVLPQERRSALLVPVPAEGLVDGFRQRHLAATVARRLPPHVTVLFPFAPVEDLDAALIEQLRSHFSSCTSFTAELTRVGRFDAHVWLAPEPHAQFVALLTATFARFPGFPPYGNAFAEAVPHVTIAEVGANATVEHLEELAEQELGPVLPFGFAVGHVGLFEELSDGTWRQADSFELG